MVEKMVVNNDRLAGISFKDLIIQLKNIKAQSFSGNLTRQSRSIIHRGYLIISTRSIWVGLVAASSPSTAGKEI